MSRYIRIEDAVEAAINGCASWDGGYFPSMDEPIKEEFEAVADKCIDLVRCKDCKHTKDDGCGAIYCKVWDRWEMPEDYFCADGERRSE